MVFVTLGLFSARRCNNVPSFAKHDKKRLKCLFKLLKEEELFSVKSVLDSRVSWKYFPLLTTDKVQRGDNEGKDDEVDNVHQVDADKGKSRQS